MDHQRIGNCLNLFKKIRNKKLVFRKWILYFTYNARRIQIWSREKWLGIKSVFKAVYTILHDTPARRKDFISVTSVERFSLFFCTTRWVEDTVVADRLNEIWESIKDCKILGKQATFLKKFF